MTLAFTTAVLVLGLAGYYAAGAVRRRRREAQEAVDRERARAAATRLRAARAVREGMPPRPRPVPSRRWCGPVDAEFDPCGAPPIRRQQ
jgi:hypothetical protein